MRSALGDGIFVLWSSLILSGSQSITRVSIITQERTLHHLATYNINSPVSTVFKSDGKLKIPPGR